MSRWTKSIVVPLDSLCKEKENTNRPTVARSVGTVGKWGKMGFTSTRTYALSALPASVAAAAAAAAAAAVVSPTAQQSPASVSASASVSALDDDLSPSVPEPTKPKKFFKSRNAAPPEVIAQMIQQLPRTSTSPIRDSTLTTTTTITSMPNYLSTPVHGREPIKLKIPKSNNSTERNKKKSPKKNSKLIKVLPLTNVTASAAAIAASIDDDDDEFISDGLDLIPQKSDSPINVEPKFKKKKEEKKLKPEAPPSRIISRTRKTVNYCEDDEDERMSTPVKDIVVSRNNNNNNNNSNKLNTKLNEHEIDEPVLPPPAAPALTTSTTVSAPAAANITPKTPEHPPIVLRISKGTSRLVSTDSEEQQTNAINSPQQYDTEPTKIRHTSTDEVPAASTNTPNILQTTPKIIVKPPKPPSPELQTTTQTSHSNDEEPPEINYCTVQISPDKPPKERLKLIIKTDVIRNAIAAAAAAKAAAAVKAAATNDTTVAADSSSLPGAGDTLHGERLHEKEKKSKSKKHKHLKHTNVEQLTPATHVTVAGSEFKTPSPHLALGNSSEQPNAAIARTVISPPALSERDFDSQSSVLGSFSSKGNSTPQLLAQTIQEESCVIHSRGSSVITSDLETSQHSSLVAPPSDIELRLESMMMEGEMTLKANKTVEEQPLEEDILAVLRGEEIATTTTTTTTTITTTATATEVKVNGTADREDVIAIKEINEEPITKRRVTRGRGRPMANKTNYVENTEDIVSQKAHIATRGTRSKKPIVSVPQVAEEAPILKRGTRRGRKKSDELTQAAAIPMETEDQLTKITATEETSQNNVEEEKATAQQTTTATATTTATTTARRGRSTRSTTNNNNLISNNNNNNNNNINKIATNLTTKTVTTSNDTKVNTNLASTISTTRSYGRKRKNQQTNVSQTLVDEIEYQQNPTPAKMASIDLPTTTTTTIDRTSLSTSPTRQNKVITPDLHDTNSNSDSLTRPSSATPSSPPHRDYKVKDKFKRTLTLDNQVNFSAVTASPTASLPADGGGGSGGGIGGVGVSGNNDDEQQRGSVKLVISKKNSIFKSRALVTQDQSEQSTITKRHLYKHRWDAEANGGTPSHDNNSSTNTSDTQSGGPPVRTTVDSIFDDFSEDLSNSAHDNSPIIGKLTRVTKPNSQVSTNSYDIDADIGQSDTITSLKIDRKAKEYYTVVRNVKTAHQIQEIGEYQEMDDDVEYILDALQSHNPTPTRCLSALQLATKCMIPAFRMHVRAHGIVTKFFKALADANSDLSLGLCTSAIMYILSQEGLNMDLDRDSLELMMNLLEAEGVAAPSDRANYERNRQKVRELCEEIKSQGKATHLNVETITVGTLAMETLLSLTSKRAGEWFKEELRELGGLEHIIKTISECCRPVFEYSTTDATINWTQSLLDNMKTVERCMRVLENVTQMNEENQNYMLTYSKGSFVNTLCALYRLCDREITQHPTTDTTNNKDNPGTIMRELLIPVMKVLINLTHTFNSANALGAETIGQSTEMIDISFHLLLLTPNYIPEKCIFELSILVLLLLINLTMYTLPNRLLIMKTNAPKDYIKGDCNKEQTTTTEEKETAVKAVMEYFYKCEELARLVEKNTDAILDNTDKNKKKQEEVDETVNNLLQKAGHHMEHTLKGSYAAILIGHLITDSEEHEAIVRSHLRDNGFKEIVNVLEKYYTFMNLTASIEASAVAHIKSTKKLIDYFKKRDLVYEMNEGSSNCALSLDKLHTSTENSINNSNQSLDASPTVSTTTKSMGTATAAAAAAAATTTTTTTITSTTSIISSTTSNTTIAEASSSSSSSTSIASGTRSTQRVYKTYSQR